MVKKKYTFPVPLVMIVASVAMILTLSFLLFRLPHQAFGITQLEFERMVPITNSLKALTCDPIRDGLINNADFDLWLKEYTGQVSTTLTSCYVPGNNTENILNFQVWKDINYRLKQSF